MKVELLRRRGNMSNIWLFERVPPLVRVCRYIFVSIFTALCALMCELVWGAHLRVSKIDNSMLTKKIISPLDIHLMSVYLSICCNLGKITG